MALSHPRSPSPDNQIQEPLKKQKSTHPPPSEDSVPPAFLPDVFDHTNIARLNTSYRDSQPYHYAVVEKLFQDDLLNKVKDEIRSELSFTTKETDIYKVNQTGDLASLSYLDSAEISLLPNLLALRDALYSKSFRDFLRSVTGCGPLSGTKQDMSVNSYTKGCHLLNHDDVIGTRRVSYILYMPLPTYQGWQADWGGALELYPVKEGADEPDSMPHTTIPPSWNQFIFFEVQPGRSFHSVEEVVVGGEGEDGRERLSISGWFHAAQEGEEGYIPMPPSEHKSSREQLTSTTTSFRPYNSSSPPPMPTASLTPEQVSFLSEFLNPVYLQPRTMKALAARFVEESSLELHSFLTEPLASKLAPGLIAIDEKDGLGKDRQGRIPPHTAGVDTPSPPPSPPNPSSSGSTTPPLSQTPTWTLKGPPHKWRYCVLSPPTSANVTSLVTPRSFFTSPAALLRSLQDELFPSSAFRAWLAIVTTLLPMGCSAEARRFRPGLDYRLATSDENEARLDVVLGLTPEQSGSPQAAASGAADQSSGWQTGEWGGWECYMAPHDEEDDPAVYRSSSHKKKHAENDAPNGHVDAESSSSAQNGHSSHDCGCGHSNEAEATEEAADNRMDDDEPEQSDEEEEDNTLLTVQPGYNRLLLVLRDERVMRFVKYVSAAAEGSRWDVCSEYEVGAVVDC